MIVDDLDTVCGATLPDEAEPPSIVNPDAVLSNPVAFERLQVIAWRRAQIVEPDRGIQDSQLPACHDQDVRRKTLRDLTGKNKRRAFASEAFDRHCYVSRNGRYVKHNTREEPNGK
jgi:hypothetical protein